MNFLKKVCITAVSLFILATAFPAFSGGFKHATTYQNKKLEYAYYVPKSLKPQKNIEPLF